MKKILFLGMENPVETERQLDEFDEAEWRKEYIAYRERAEKAVDAAFDCFIP